MEDIYNSTLRVDLDDITQAITRRRRNLIGKALKIQSEFLRYANGVEKQSYNYVRFLNTVTQKLNDVKKASVLFFDNKPAVGTVAAVNNNGRIATEHNKAMFYLMLYDVMYDENRFMRAYADYDIPTIADIFLTCLCDDISFLMKRLYPGYFDNIVDVIMKQAYTNDAPAGPPPPAPPPAGPPAPPVQQP